MPRIPSSTIEVLESRIAPAGGIITVEYDAQFGVLTVSGSPLIEEFEILAVGPNATRIQTIGVTGIAGGGTVMEVGKVTSLIINTGDGDDTVIVSDLARLTAFSFDGGGGDDTFTAFDFKVKGAAAFTDGSGNDTVTLDGSFATVSGNLSFTNATGDYAISIDTPRTAIGGAITFNGGTGSSDLALYGGGTASVAKGILIDAANSSFASLVISGTMRSTIGKSATGESVRIIGGAGETMVNFETGAFSFLGGISVSSEADRQVSFETNQRVALGKLPTGESILLQGAGASQEVSIDAAGFAAAGGIALLGTASAQRVTVEVPQGKLTLGKVPVTGASIDVAGGSGNDTIEVEAASATLAGGIRFNGTNGSDSVELLSPNGSFRIGKLVDGQSISYEGGAGTDRLSFLNASLVTSGGIYFNSIGGNNTVEFRSSGGNATIGKLPNGASLVFNGGTGNDRITSNFAGVNLLGGIEASMGAGNNVLLLRDFALFRIGALPNGQSINYTGSTGENYVELTGATALLKGSLEFETFGTFASVSLNGNIRVGPGFEGVALDYRGSGGQDRMVFVGSIQLGGGLLFDGAAGADRLETENLDFFSALGPVTFTGGADDDVFDFDGPIRLANALTFTGGAGTDTFLLAANGTISGAVNVDLGAATASSQVALLTSHHHRQHGLVLNSSLDVLIDGTSATTDVITLTNLRVLGALQLTSGEAISFISIDNLIAGSTFDLEAGGGGDQVFIETGSFSGNSVIRGLANFTFGAGDDIFRLGSPGPQPNGGLQDETRVRFFSVLTLDAGGGNDTRNNFIPQNDFLGGEPVGEETFESISPDIIPI